VKTSVLNIGRKAVTSSRMQAVIFDLDGVLMNSEWISYLVWADVAREYGGILHASAYPGMVGLTAEETGEYVMREAGVSFDLASTVARVWQLVTDRISAGIEPLPGAVALVQELAQRGYPLAIASNSPVGYIENALHGLKLRPYFKEIVGVDQVEQGKPDPEVYLCAAERLGVSPGFCLAIEDSQVGSQAALRAGMRVLAVPAAEDSHDKFFACFRIYESLVQVGEELEEVLS